MTKKPQTSKESAEKVVKNIRRKTLPPSRTGTPRAAPASSSSHHTGPERQVALAPEWLLEAMPELTRSS
jgi:hypothetical protein